MDDVAVEEVHLEIWIWELFDAWISPYFVLKVDNLIVTDQVCVLVRGLNERVSVLKEVCEGLLATEMLQLHHTEMWRHEAIAVALLT